MKNNHFKNYFFVFSMLCSSFWACKSVPKPVPVVDNKVKIDSVKIPTLCNTKGKVVDFTNVDGCNYFIRLPDSTFLQPVESAVEGLRIEPGQALQFGFEKQPNVMSVCNVKSQAIKLTCAVVLNVEQLKIDNPEVLIECFDVYNTNDAPWLKVLVKQSKPTSIIKYPYFYNEKAYLVRLSNHSVLYDCRGNAIMSGTDRDCRSHVVDPSGGRVIYQAEGVNE
jgi:hypothetical protein